MPMAKRGKPLGNKRQRERDKARKKRDKEARREARKVCSSDETEVLDASASADRQEDSADDTEERSEDPAPKSSKSDG